MEPTGSEYRFNISWSAQDNNYVAICPEFPGVSGFGATRAQALAEAEISLELAIEAYREEGWDLPTPVGNVLRRVSNSANKYALTENPYKRPKLLGM